MKYLYNTIELNQYDQYRGMRCYFIDINTVLLPIGYCEHHYMFRAETGFFIR